MRAILKTYPSYLEAELASQELAELGVPTCVIQAANPAPYSPNAISALWIEDANLLDDPVLRAEIEAALGEVAMREDDEEAIIRMEQSQPEVDPQRTYVAFVAIGLAATLIIVGLVMHFQAIAQP